MIDGEYTPDPTLAALALELAQLHRRLCFQRKPQAEILAIMRSFAQGYLRSIGSSRTEIDEDPINPTRRALPQGVYRAKNGKRFIAMLNTPTKKNQWIGTFDHIDEAEAAYQRAHIEHFGSQSKFYKDEHHEPTE